MQILVISDTHGHYSILRDTILKHPDVQSIVFCGDGDEEIARFCAEYPKEAARLFAVRGNCDHTPGIPSRAVLQLPYGHRLVALHGHTCIGGDFKKNLLAVAKEEKADIVAFGHTHVRTDERCHSVHLFNPGSAAVPRDGKPASFGLIDIFESGVLTSHGDLPPSPYDMRW